jgi:hypothetical protein
MSRSDPSYLQKAHRIRKKTLIIAGFRLAGSVPTP